MNSKSFFWRWLLALGCLCATAACTPKTDSQGTSGNPIFMGWYADPDMAVFQGRYWIFPTYSAAYESQTHMDAFSSEDLVNWRRHPNIIDTAAITWAKRALWAPSAVEKAGKFYLFFSANDLQHPQSPWWDPAIHELGQIGGIGVAVADEPAGPYRDLLGEPLIGEVLNGAQPIDPFVFSNDEGQFFMAYGGWGKCNLVQLADDFSKLVPFADGSMAKDITPPGYVEGPVLFKRQDWYYLMWSEGNWTDSTYQVAYGRSESIAGPYQKLGAVLQPNLSLATGAGHHSVLNPPGTDSWYIAYHRRPIPNQGRDHRVVCLDTLVFDQNGHVVPTTISEQGVYAKPLKR